MNDYFEAARNTGIVQVIPQNGNIAGSVMVWVGPGISYTFLSYGAMNAYWSGNRLVIQMEGGSVRSYSSCDDYEIIKF